MTRRAQFLLLFIIPIGLLPLFWVASCAPPPPPPTQAIATKSSASDDTVQPATADEKKIAQERIAAAIKAHGGADKLRKLNRHVQRLHGMLKTGLWGVINADHDIKQDLPDRLSLIVNAVTRDGPQNIVLVVDGDKSWMSENGNARDLLPPIYKSVREELYYRRVMTLVPLESDDFVIRPIDGETVSGRPTNGVRVGAKNHHTVDLFFDAESGLLVRTLHPAWSEAGAIQKREVLLAGHQEFEGLKLPTRVVDKRDNDRIVDCTADYKFVKEFDAKEFARPQ